MLKTGKKLEASELVVKLLQHLILKVRLVAWDSKICKNRKFMVLQKTFRKLCSCVAGALKCFMEKFWRRVLPFHWHLL